MIRALSGMNCKYLTSITNIANREMLVSVYRKYMSLRHSFIVMTLLLNACTTSTQIAGEDHRSAAQKWYALSQYTTSHLPTYGYSITARLETTTLNSDSGLQLTKIKLEPKADNFRLNLLKPNFMDKYICSPQCSQLIEYESEQGENGETLLATYLTQYEFELFAFYGEMFVLNDVLSSLRNENEQLLYEYLRYVSTKQDEFTSLKEMTTFLKGQLTLPAFRQFVNEPELRYEGLANHFLKNNKAHFNPKQPEELWGYVSSSSNDDSALISPDLNWNKIESALISPDENWNKIESTSNPVEHWSLASESKEQLLWLVQKETQSEISVWEDAKHIPIELGTYVCSFTDNYFGMVFSVTPIDVIVLIQGQANTHLDGMNNNLPIGSLFHENANIEFLPMVEKRTFLRTDIAPCAIQGENFKVNL
jgi:hypothetical protein